MKTEDAVGKVRDLIRLKHYSDSTEDAYCHYVEQFCEHSKLLPKDWPTEKRIESYLSTTFADASASAQNCAFNAVLFLYRNILGVEPKGINALRARRPVHHRNAPAPEESRAILKFIAEHETAEISLAVDAIYGCGGRVSEPLNLRIRDVVLHGPKPAFIFRQAKHHQDRVVPIPCALLQRVQEQIDYARTVWQREGQRWPVQLPGKLHLKYPQAPFAWHWFWLFPAKGPCRYRRDPERLVRWRLGEWHIRRVVQRACRALGLAIVPHELRHGYATDCLNNGQNPRALQKVMGHKSLETTMGYCHAEALSVASPLDGLKERG
jgi:integrase